MTAPTQDEVRAVVRKADQPSKRKLVAAIKELHGIVQLMQMTYANDVAQGRAEAMQRLAEQAQAVAWPIVNEFPSSFGSRAFLKDQANVD
jgi:hypothetical protein